MSTVAPGEFANEFKLYTSNPDTDTAAQPVTLRSAINAHYPEIYSIQWNTATFAQIPASGTFNYWIQVPNDGSFFDAMGAIEARFLVRRRGILAGVIPNLVASNTLTFEVVDAPLPAPDAVPTAPATLTATAGDGQVELSWAVPDLTSGNTNRLNDVQITTCQYRPSPDGGTTWTPDWADIPNSGLGQAHGTHYRVTGLTNDVPYTYRLRVRDVDGRTSLPAAVTVTPRAAPPLPIALTVRLGSVPVGGGQRDVITLQWDRPDDIDSLTHYDYQYRTGAAVYGPWTQILGLVTPYGGTTLGPLARYRLGSRWRHPSGLQLSLEGTRQAPTGRQPVNQGVRLQAEWRF